MANKKILSQNITQTKNETVKNENIKNLARHELDKKFRNQMLSIRNLSRRPQNKIINRP